jgi:hypothetical protein
MKPRRLLDPFSGARTVRYYSHFGTHPSRVPEKFSSFLSSAYRSAFCNPFAFRFMQEWVGVGVAFPISPLATSHSPLVGGLLLLSKLKAPINRAESTLLKVLILKQLKVPLESITFEKQGEGSPLWLTNCCKQGSAGNVRWNPGLPSSVHTSKFRIPQVLCLPLLRKYPGCGGILPILELVPLVVK